MDREKIQIFITTAGSALASVRTSLLIAAQSGDGSDLTIPRRNLAQLRSEAFAANLNEVAARCSECIAALDVLTAAAENSPKDVYAALDLVARIDAAIWETPSPADDFPADVSGFVDASFDEFMPQTNRQTQTGRAEEEFEIDDETLDIFRSEADDLLANIANGIAVLSNAPADQNALWDIRRSAHTFKGSAGIVGLRDASAVAHRMEDLLDKIVKLGRPAEPRVIEFLTRSATRLNDVVSAKNIDDDTHELDGLYADVMMRLSRPAAAGGETAHKGGHTPKTAAPPPVGKAVSTITPVVRVSLDRLDELIAASRDLVISHSLLAETLAPTATKNISLLLDAQRDLTVEIQAKLLQIRMVKFGTLETRLSRAVRVTCVDENKKAVVEIENGEVEIDTQAIDTLIEPLLHLLKNAVVHGVEAPDVRRLIGKPEHGRIRIRLEADSDTLILSVTDDGAGVSRAKLKEKALAGGIITARAAAEMVDSDALQLIFERGLTTAGKIDMNAGRGVGMGIVKESVESRGGSVLVSSEPQKGAAFTIVLPLKKADAGAAGACVLIIDDSASIRHQTKKIVEAEGCRVITADNGAAAIGLLRSGACRPDLILSDVEMPQIDGWQLLKYVKTDRKFARIPVIMVTSLDAPKHRQRALELGAADLLLKPLNKEKFAKVRLNCRLL